MISGEDSPYNGSRGERGEGGQDATVPGTVHHSVVVPDPPLYLFTGEKIGIVSLPPQSSLEGEGAVTWANPFYVLFFFFSRLSLNHSQVFDKYLLSIYYIADTIPFLGE